MGGAVKSFFKGVAKAVVSHVGGLVPVVGTPIANYINSKYAKGSFDIGNIGVAIPDGVGTKAVNTPAQLKALVEKFPDQAAAAGLTKDMITTEVKEAKEMSKAIGGLIKMKHYPHGGKVDDSEEKLPPPNPKAREKMKDIVRKIKQKRDREAAMELYAKAKNRYVEADKFAKSEFGEKKFATGGKVRSPAQLEATRKLVEANRKRRAQK
jgi:hypothetical protein